MVLRAASQSGPRYPPRASGPLAVGDVHERALVPLLILLLDGMVGGAFINFLLPLRLAFEAVEDRSDPLLARGMSSGDVEEILGGSRALTS